MTGFTAFYRKELHEIVRTWRIWTLPGLVLFFAIASPILTVMMPAILSTVTAGQPGVVIRMPEPTAVMACQQFLKNLNQVVLIAVVLIAAGSIPNERRSGVAMLVLTKPLSRAGYVLAKLLSQLTLVVVAVIAGSGLCALITRLLFGDLPAGPFFAAIGLWLTLAAFLLSVVTLLSVLCGSAGAAAGIGLGVYLLVFLLSMWGPAARLTPLGLAVAGPAVLAGGDPAVFVPVPSGLLASALLTAITTLIFQRKDL